VKIALPHDLGREEVRRRLRARGHEIADHIPGGMADVETGWPSEDVMAIGVRAMGQSISGKIEIFEDQVVFEIDLPPALSFVRPLIEGAIRKNAPKLLENS
jgi:hypothetical protein